MEYRVCRNNPAPYNDLNGKISLLGLGTMRLPLRDAADQTSIDEEKAQEIFDYAYAHGVNYFDTAYPYHGGMSEKFCGKALAKYPRASYHLASKLPGCRLPQRHEAGLRPRRRTGYRQRCHPAGRPAAHHEL